MSQIGKTIILSKKRKQQQKIEILKNKMPNGLDLNEAKLDMNTEKLIDLSDKEECKKQKIIGKSDSKTITVLPTSQVMRDFVLAQSSDLNFEPNISESTNFSNSYVAVEVDVDCSLNCISEPSKITNMYSDKDLSNKFKNELHRSLNSTSNSLFSTRGTEIHNKCILLPNLGKKDNANKILVSNNQSQKHTTTLNKYVVPRQTVSLLKTRYISLTNDSCTISTKVPLQETEKVKLIDLKSLPKSQVLTGMDNTYSTAVMDLHRDTPSTSTSSHKDNIVENVTNTNFLDSSSDEEESDNEDFELNSINELKDFWKLLVELHVYNKRVIKRLRQKRIRSLKNITKLENHLKNEFGLKIELLSEQKKKEKEIPVDDIG